MVTFRNNNGRRNSFRRNDRNFKSNSDRTKFSSNFSNSDNFQRKIPGRNNHNAPKLIEKYNNLAREALSSGDKILSEKILLSLQRSTRKGYNKSIIKTINENIEKQTKYNNWNLYLKKYKKELKWNKYYKK